MSWNALEAVRSFRMQRAACPGLTAVEWAEDVARRLVTQCERRGEALGTADRGQLTWLIAQQLEDALAAVPMNSGARRRDRWRVVRSRTRARSRLRRANRRR